jgi:hypothetical protein
VLGNGKAGGLFAAATVSVRPIKARNRSFASVRIFVSPATRFSRNPQNAKAGTLAGPAFSWDFPFDPEFPF